MTNEYIELTWLDEQHQLSFNELISLSGLTQQELSLLVENGALLPSNIDDNPSHDALLFCSHCLVSIRTLSRLKNDFEIESNALSLTLVLLERIRALELQLHHLDSNPH